MVQFWVARNAVDFLPWVARSNLFGRVGTHVSLEFEIFSSHTRNNHLTLYEKSDYEHIAIKKFTASGGTVKRSDELCESKCLAVADLELPPSQTHAPTYLNACHLEPCPKKLLPFVYLHPATPSQAINHAMAKPYSVQVLKYCNPPDGLAFIANSDRIQHCCTRRFMPRPPNER